MKAGWRVGRTVLAVLLTLAAVLALPGPRAAFAHASLVEVVPADGAVLETAPSRLTLRFNEPVEITSLRIVDGAGTSRALVPSGTGPSEVVEVPLPPLADGRHAVSWRMISADGHPVAGSAVFAVGAGAVPPIAGEAAPEAGAGTGLLRGIARALAYAGCLMAAGGALFSLLLSSPAVDRAAQRSRVAGAAALGAVASLVAAGVDHAILSGGAAEASWLAAGSWIGPVLLLRLAGLVLLSLSAIGSGGAIGSGAASAVSVLAGTGAVVLSFALTGHAGGQGLALPAALVAIHLLGGAFWLGALLPLQAACRHPDRAAVSRLMARFSAVAIMAVPVLIGAGLWLAVILVGGWAELAGTQYGRLLAAKVLLVAAMLGLAALNRWRFSPLLARDPAASARLGRSIRAEAVLGLAVLGLTATLTSGPPPAGPAQRHAAHREAEEAWRSTAQAGPYRLALRVLPARAGENAVEVAVAGPDGAPAGMRRVVLVLSNPGLGIEGIGRAMEEAGPGLYRYRGPDLIAPGSWRLAVELLVGDFEKRRAEVELPVR